MHKIEGGNVQKGLAQGIAQKNYRPFSQVIRGNLRLSFFFRENAKSLCVSFHWKGGEQGFKSYNPYEGDWEQKD
jgi:hypothetical protein